MHSIINPATLPPARTFHAWSHPDDLRDISARDRLGALLDRRDEAAQELKDALILALLIEALGGPGATDAHSLAQMRLLDARLSTGKIQGELTLRWPREIGGALPLPCQYPEPPAAPQSPDEPAMTHDELWMERAIAGAGMEAMRKRLAAGALA